MELKGRLECVGKVVKLRACLSFDLEAWKSIVCGYSYRTTQRRDQDAEAEMGRGMVD